MCKFLNLSKLSIWKTRPSSGASDRETCKFFLSTGCKFGANCHFKHVGRERRRSRSRERRHRSDSEDERRGDSSDDEVERRKRDRKKREEKDKVGKENLIWDKPRASVLNF